MARIGITCHECGHSAKVPVSFAGKRVRCLRCQTKLRVPEAPAGAPSAKPRARTGATRQGRNAPPPPSTARRRSRRRKTRGPKGPAHESRRKAEMSVREILEDYEFAIEPDGRGFLIDVRGVAFGLARTLVEEILEDAPGVRDVRLAGGTGEVRITVILKGASFDPDDSFADEDEETEVYHRKAAPQPRGLDMDAIVRNATFNDSALQVDPAQRLADDAAEADAPAESLIGLVPVGSIGMGELDGVGGLVDKGRKLLEADRVDQAVQLLEKAVRIDKDHEEAVYTLATAYASLGEYQRARRAFRHFSKLCPGDPDGHVMHAAAAVACDRLEDAKLALATAIKIDANHAKAYRYAARLYDRLGDPVMAQKFRRKYKMLKG